MTATPPESPLSKLYYFACHGDLDSIRAHYREATQTASNDDEALAQKLIDRLEGKTGNTCLQGAVLHNQLEMVKLLLSAEGFEADPDQQNKDRWTALQLAVQKNASIPLVLVLLEAGANPSVTFNEESPLFIAAAGDFRDIVHVLCKLEELDVNQRCNDRGRRALHIAAEKGHLQTLRLLLDYGADPNLQGNAGCTALILAATRAPDPTDVITALLQANADPHLVSGPCGCPIHHTTIRGLLKMVELLLAHPASDVNVRDPFGNTPLMHATSSCALEGALGHTPGIDWHPREPVVEFLLDKGADVNLRDSNGSTAMFDVASPEMVRMLVEAGADVNTVRTDEQFAAARVVLEQFDMEIVSASIAKCPKFLILCRSPVNENCAKGKGQVVAALLEAGADPTLIEPVSGFTLLHLAVITGQSTLVKDLLCHEGVQVDAIDAEHCTALYHATVAGDQDTVEILLSGGADPNLHTNTGRVPLHVAVEEGFTEMVNALLAHGALKHVDCPGQGSFLNSGEGSCDNSRDTHVPVAGGGEGETFAHTVSVGGDISTTVSSHEATPSQLARVRALPIPTDTPTSGSGAPGTRTNSEPVASLASDPQVSFD